MSDSRITDLLCRPARWLGFVLTLLVVLSAPFCAFAQEQRPRDFRRDLARSKAERFERMRLAELSQTANQADYDVTYYDLDLDIDPVAQTVGGTVTVTAEVTAASLSTVDLNLFNNMAVTDVRDSEGSLAYSHAGDMLTVTLPATYALGESFTIYVDYSGTPDTYYGSFGFNTVSGQPMIWSLSEPFGARTWWPCKDIPSDKADSVDVRITVPDNLIVASNGLLVSEVDNGSTKTYHWHEGYPITTYLVSVAIHPYTTFSHWYHYSPTDSMEVAYFVFAAHYSAVQSTYALTVPMIEVFASLFGEYPFLNEKYGHAEFVWGGGMEHQTITSLGGYSEYLIVHELAHSWWGDMVTCDSFHHIWLNEGFATYSEALWSEVAYGTAQYHEDMQQAEYFGAGTIYVPDPSDFNRIFHSGLSYNKASWVLHMLRHIVGDATFFQILQTYYADSRYQYATATTEEFRDLCEAVSGMDLDWFFHEWIYEEYYPQYAYDWTSTPVGGHYEIDLTIDQLQTNYIFKMPIDFTVTTAGGDTTFVVWDSLATQSFTFNVVGAPEGFQLDKDAWILRTIDEPLKNPTFDRGVLVVNGVDFDEYGSEISTAYEDSVFWGDYDMTFWDVFGEPASGYPSNLPAPIGHGAVPVDIIKQFSSVVWVGNNYNGDLQAWADTAILKYLENGGNVLLMTRMGQNFISEPLRDYLGITWREYPTTLNNCVTTHPGVVSMAILPGATQSYCAVFDTTLATTESTLLLLETATFATNRGLGVYRHPTAGGTHRADGGRFAFISGRPYRWDHDHLRTNVEYILGTCFNEPFTPTAVASDPPGPRFELGQNYPNPFNPETRISFTVPSTSELSLKIYDVSGRLVRNLVAGRTAAGPHTVHWDGTNNAGESVASGVYFYRLVTGSRSATKKMVLLR